jgi:hypothetical protein
MALEGDRVSRGRRVQELQADEPAMEFCIRLNSIASELGLPAAWNPARLSKVRNGIQDLSMDDAAVLARADPQQRGWTWIAYGVAARKGEDAWAVLARTAKKGSKSA